MNLHKLQQGFIVTSDEPIKEGDLQYYFGQPISQVIVKAEKDLSNDGRRLKVLYQEPNIILSSLSEAEQKVIGWFDVERLGKEYSNKVNHHPNQLYPNSGETLGEVTIVDFIKGFRKAQSLLSDRRFTKQDMIEFACSVFDSNHGSYSASFRKRAEVMSESLNHQSWKIEAIEEDGKIKVMKLL